MPPQTWVLDTNVLLRFFGSSQGASEEIDSSLISLSEAGASLFYTSQILAEFWNVSTRPAAANGLGRSVSETNEAAEGIEAALTLAPDSEAVHTEWRKLIFNHLVSGAQVHDARIVATMRVNNITNLLTLNVEDFLRYTSILAVTPHDLLTRNQ